MVASGARAANKTSYHRVLRRECHGLDSLDGRLCPATSRTRLDRGSHCRYRVVASLARPGGNVTGQSLQKVDLASKRLELLREIVPHLRRLAILFNADFSQPVAEAEGVKATAHRL
jgi:hypothetical protein